MVQAPLYMYMIWVYSQGIAQSNATVKQVKAYR
jgi:hypothetical protein